MKTWRGTIILGNHKALFAGVSLAALIASGAIAPARATNVAGLLSPAAIAQAAAQQATGVQSANGGSTALSSAATQAQIAVSTANLAKAAQAIKNIAAAQSAASAASQLTLNNAPLSGSAWNGTTLSGLSPTNQNDPSLWDNAGPLQKDKATGTATIKQTASKALLTWTSLDLNKGETLIFDQQGNADWTVLNRIVAGPVSASGSRYVASPSYILGSIKADGTVYIINPNGVIFGPNAEVNVHSLIASSLDVGDPTMDLAERNSFYLNQGITTATGVEASFSYYQNDAKVQGNVEVMAGATITTDLAPRTVSPDAGGFVYLIAPNVENDGAISTPAGETMMVAAQIVQLTPNQYNGAGIDVATSTFRAIGPNFNLDSQNQAAITPWQTDGPAGGQIRKPGQVINTGLIDAERGVVILDGDEVTDGALKNAAGTVTQVGVIRADTSITRNSQIFLTSRIETTISGGASIQILPDENGETIPQSALDSSTAASPSFVPGSVAISGNTVNIASGSLIEAPGGSVALTGVSAPAVDNENFPGALLTTVQAAVRQSARIYMAPDSTIDVSGLDDVVLPMSDNLLSFKPFGNEFADQPLQRNGALRGVELTVDIRQTGTNSDGTTWVGTPLADLTALAGDINRSIDYLLTTGGKVSVSSQQQDEIILAKGSTVNVAGGYVQYQGGVVDTSNLVTADGRIVNIADANPLDTYVGVAGVTTSEHPHWGATTTLSFVNPILTQSQYQPGYVEGRDAGGITLSSATQTSVYALNGSLYAGTIIGEEQAAGGVLPNAATANTVLASATALPSSGYLKISGSTNLDIVAQAQSLPSDFTINSTLPIVDQTTTTLSSQSLSAAGFGAIQANFSGKLTVASDADLTVADGGSIAIKAGSADIEGAMTARSGSISIETDSSLANNGLIVLTEPTPPDSFNLVLGSKARLDVSGLWVNDSAASPETEMGGGYVNGGSISLKTDSVDTTNCATRACTSLAGLGTSVRIDITGSIILDSGSRLDVSSGGRIGTNGHFQVDSQGRAVGKGGNLTLATYNNGFKSSGPIPTTSTPSAGIVFEGSDGTAAATAAAFERTVSAAGFEQGGTLSITAPGITIGERGKARTGVFALPASFFAGNSFSAYSLNSVVSGTVVAAGAKVTVNQQNLTANPDLVALTSGAKVEDATGVSYLPTSIRTAAGLSLGATLAPLPREPYKPPPTTDPIDPAVALLIGQGATITTDPGATVQISVAGRNSDDDANQSVIGNIAQQTGVAEILGTITDHGGAISLAGGAYSEIWLGASSRLDASGEVVIDTRQTLYRAGTVLAGGSVSLTSTPADPSDAVIALKGAVIDVSGAVGTLDIRQNLGTNGLPAAQYTPTSVWSDAGSITLSAPTLLYDGKFVADRGAPLANGGSLTVGTPSAQTLTITEGGALVPKGLKPTDLITALAGEAVFKANSLNGSGIAALTLTAGSTSGPLSPGTVQFTGNVTIAGLDQLTVDASTIAAASVHAVKHGCTVCLSANYIDLQGTDGALGATGKGILRVQADMIDLGDAQSSTGLTLSGFANAEFISRGDIRLGAPLSNVTSTNAPGSLVVGALTTAGNLTLDATQIYPESDVDFTLKSSAAHGRITFGSTGKAAYAPLSAGGQVTVDAATIDQGGALLAPLGVIRLGAKTTADLSPDDTSGVFVATRKVVLLAGSTTSVSLAGQTVPFGETADGKNWSYNSSDSLPLPNAPAKDITLSANKIDLAKGSTINLSGGGDIQASEFVPGTGGTRDVLSGANEYAIIPGYNPVAAPVDFDFAKIQGDAEPLAGSTVYLTGIAGLPAGTYTLLPAHYATLPGAYRVSVVSGVKDAISSQNAVLADGTLQVAGYLGNSVDGTRSARSALFDVQSSSVWRQYTEIDETSGNTYFKSLAASAASTASTARLPVDAGHLVINALNGVNLQGQLLAAAGTGGAGSEVDIAGTDLEVLGAGKAASGYVGLSASQLSALGADSLLIGGVRSDSAAGETIDVTADSVVVSNDSKDPLTGPEIILVTAVPKLKRDPHAGTGLQVDGGSVIKGVGSLATGDPTTFAFASGDHFQAGEGALLAVSSGPAITITRTGASYQSGDLTIRSGATLSGGSMTADATGSIRIASGSTFSLNAIALSSSGFALGAAPAGARGAALDNQVLDALARANSLSFRSALGTIEFFGDTGIAMSQPTSTLTLDAGSLIAAPDASVTLSAGAQGTVSFTNTGNGVTGAVTDGKGRLTVKAGAIDIDSGAQQWNGLSSVSLTGSEQVAVRGAGSLNIGAATLSVDTPRLLVGGGAQQSITTTSSATVTSAAGAGAVSTTTEVGGTLTIDASAITVDTLIQATAGGLTLEAASGDITLGARARLDAQGFAQTFFDVTKYAGGGSVSLIADGGNITATTGSQIIVSSPQAMSGYAGAVTLSAADGTISSGQGVAFDPTIIAGVVSGDSGGSLAVDAKSFGASFVTPTLFSNTVDIHVRDGDFGLAANLTAHNVTLTVDAGTLTIDRTIDASGAKGGSISLFGGQGVVLGATGALLATASDASKRGGDVVIGTEVAADNGSTADGVITLDPGGIINVSNTANASNGGTVRLRAPLAASGDDVAIAPVQSTIAGASSVTVEAFRVFAATNGDPNKSFNGVIDPINDPGFYGSCDANGNCTGVLIDFVEGFALSAASQQKFATISPGVLHLQPGIELVNNDPTVNGGNITVASNWNLGAGIATGLIADPSGAPGAVEYGPNSVITKLFYRTDGGSPLGEPGALTLRAIGDVDINASITDGFFQTANRMDPTYIQNLYAWVQNANGNGATTDILNVGGYILAGPTANDSIAGAGPLPVAPYIAAANGISPIGTKEDLTPIAGADLFPLIQDKNGAIQGSDGVTYSAVGSWSYRIVGGADAISANPLALQPLSVFADGGGTALSSLGNVKIGGGGAVTSPYLDSDGVSTTLEIPTIVRTGTGSIDIAAGRDFQLVTPDAPGVVYTAGRSSVTLPDPAYKMTTIDDPLNTGQTIMIATAANPSGFLTPDLLTCDPGSAFNCNAYGPITQAAYPVDGGHLTVTAQRDIIGVEDTSIRNRNQIPTYQYFAPWLIAQGTQLSNTQYGVFSTLSAYVTNGSTPFGPAQTSWWINFGSFDQGLMSVGGDVRVVAGRDIDQLGVSLPTTARTTGGLSATITGANGKTVANVPVTEVEASGDLTVIAGRNINSGAYYEGSGQATITVGGAVQANWSAYADPSDHTTALIPVSAVLAVDTGVITLTAKSSIDLAGVVSAISLQNVADVSGVTNTTLTSSYLSSYGPLSGVNVESVAGNVVVNSLPSGGPLIYNGVYVNFREGNDSQFDPGAFRGVTAYPANFSAIALDGGITVENALQLASSDTGTIDLLAYDSLLTRSETNFLGGGGTIYGNTLGQTVTGFQALSTGASLVEQQFDPTDPLSGFAPPAGSLSLDLGAKLLHVGDTTPDLFYAVTGDIVSGQGQTAVTATSPAVYPLSWEITKASTVHAGTDIIDLPFFGQNLAATDVTQIIAGRDLFYTGALSLQLSSIYGRPDLASPENAAGLSLGGPGFFDVEAGRNLGPFVTAQEDVAAANDIFFVTDSTGTGIITFGNNVTVGNRLIVDGYVSGNTGKTADQYSSGANFLLPRQGADIVTLFGVGKGVDYQTVITDYIDPATATSTTNYGPALLAFVQKLGLSAQSQSAAWTIYKSLSPKLQDIFAQQVVFNELQLAGSTKTFSTGYAAIADLFPASLGYTNNGVDGAGPATQVATGDLEMLHATIKTLQSGTATVDGPDGTQSSVAVGGDITILGPGGNIDVGSQATELNAHLTASSLGILTLDNGAIDSMTDGSLLVNQSRVLTVQGGDIILWSSNGDLDAGRGAKTTVDFKPLTVEFDPNALQTINLNGLVSGAGIGTIQSTPDAPAASATLIAPRGTVNAGDAGLRSSGNLAIVALHVLNAANISALGSVSGVPSVNSVNLGSLESASSTAGQAARAAEDSVASASSRGEQTVAKRLPSLITVEVLGFGDCDPDAGQKCPE